MCGIALLFGIKDPHKLKKQIVDMTDVIRHRGPDDEGFVFFQKNGKSDVFGGNDTPESVYQSNISFTPLKPLKDITKPYLGSMGHRRLSIVDLSAAGHQPIRSNHLWLCYNGEIYNHIELRKKLEEKGYCFQTLSDGEVILKSYEEWGTNCLHHFNGMFSFVLYDTSKNKIFAARDRFGIKPLYYWFSKDGAFAIGSEIKQFTVLDGWEPSLNRQMAYDFLNWGVTNHTDETLFEGVKQIQGGEYLEYSPTKQLVQVKRWYTLVDKPFKGTFQDASDRFGDLLKDSVRLRLRADVPVGSCLSGGLDSSSIVCLVNQLLCKSKGLERQLTFSACSEIKEYDERHFIDQIVSHTDVEAHYTYPVLENLFKVCEEILWHQEEPFASTSVYAQWKVFELVKQNHIKVILDGQGADEQLAGYHGFFGNHLYGLVRSIRWLKVMKEIATIRRMHRGLKPDMMLFDKLVPNILRNPLRKMLRKASSNPNWLNVQKLGVTDKNPFLAYPSKSLNDQSTLQLSRSNLPMLLHYEDRDSMAHSIEARTPFLDYRLVEFTLGLPPDYKIFNGWTKRVLRESMKGILPKNIQNRIDKIGFITAEEHWLTKENPRIFRCMIKESIERSNGIINSSALKLFDQMIQGKRSFNYLPWRIISFGQWLKLFDISL